MPEQSKTPSDPEEKKEKTEHFATIKMENEQGGIEQNDSTSTTTSEKDTEKDDNGLSEKKQLNPIVSSVKRKSLQLRRMESKLARLQKKIIKLGEVEKNNNTLINNAADPKDLSEGFRMSPKKQGLGLETVARCDCDSIKFEITGTKDRDDLAAFIGLTVSISGLKNNEALVDFVSAVRIVGFEEAVKHYNKHLKNKIKYYSSIRYVKPKHIEKMFFKTI